MSKRYENRGGHLGAASFEENVRELMRLELELAITFVNLAHTKYSMGNVTGGDFSRNNAEKAYRTAFRFFGKLSDVSSGEKRKLVVLLDKAKEAIEKLPTQSRTGRGGGD